MTRKNKDLKAKNLAENNSNMVFLNAALQMSWKLAIVVLIPLILGVKVDQHYKLFPYFTIIGVILAALGFYYVIWDVLREFSQDLKTKSDK
ncbi:MAG TPA: AtpZ/AtpI family protein [Candidatus Saccharimonadia bacterium]|nr:AtpZ/AtpI family protein [Candidatus Saccharimonadia bacterium]